MQWYCVLQDWQLPNWDAQDAAAAPDTAAASSLDWDLHQQQQDLGERFAHWPANLAASAEGYHPLEFYPTSQINLEWGSGSLGSFGGAGSLDMGIDRSANLGKDTGKVGCVSDLLSGGWVHVVLIVLCILLL